MLDDATGNFIGQPFAMGTRNKSAKMAYEARGQVYEQEIRGARKAFES
jgi:hypothetical protein